MLVASDPASSQPDSCVTFPGSGEKVNKSGQCRPNFAQATDENLTRQIIGLIMTTKEHAPQAGKQIMEFATNPKDWERRRIFLTYAMHLGTSGLIPQVGCHEALHVKPGNHHKVRSTTKRDVIKDLKRYGE